MAQALVCGNVAPQHGRSDLLLSTGSYASLRRKTQRLNPRQCRTCGAYQQEVEETFRPKAPSTAPGPDTTRRPPPPPPPPPPAPASGQVEPSSPKLFAVLTCLWLCTTTYQHRMVPTVPESDSKNYACFGCYMLSSLWL